MLTSESKVTSSHGRCCLYLSQICISSVGISATVNLCRVPQNLSGSQCRFSFVCEQLQIKIVCLARCVVHCLKLGSAILHPRNGPRACLCGVSVLVFWTALVKWHLICNATTA